MKAPFRTLPLALAAAAVFPACTTHTGTTALFVASALPGGSGVSDFYELPYPSDLRRNADGSLDLSLFPTNSALVDQYRQVAETLDGFALNAAMFARFSGALDPTSLPDPMASTQAGAAVYLVDVQEGSPDYGQRVPIIATFHPERTNTMGGNRLAVRPYPGFGLDDGTTYALVITKRVLDAGGKPVEPSSDFRTLVGNGGNANLVHAREVYAPLFTWLATAGGDTPQDLVSAAVFTTQHATSIAPAIRQGVFNTPAPTPLATPALTSSTTGYTLWTGNYVAPNFQSGGSAAVPYNTSGGEIMVGSDGAAIVSWNETLRFALMVPPGPTPATGWPICIYQHGTGGDWMSFVQDGTGARLAGQGIATISMDNVLSGARDPNGDPDIDFFNFTNPYAGRDNALQGYADAWSQMRLAFGMSFADTANSRTISFDPNRLMFFGHSQGGLTSPGFLAFEPALKGAVLSGTGGLLYLSLLYKTNPVNIPALIATATRDQPMDEDNPTLALVQMWIERADGANYARFFVRDPQTSSGPKNIFQSEGFIDTYAPSQTIEAFATSVGGDLVMTADEMDVAGLTQLRGRHVLAPPIMNNVAPTATAVLAQYMQAPNDDGHFVDFEIPAAMQQTAEFLGTLAATGTATVVVPTP
jgi:hypothetical protein